jgi:hypothetical protein
MRAHYRDLKARTLRVRKAKHLAVVARAIAPDPAPPPPPADPHRAEWDRLRAEAADLIARGRARAQHLAQADRAPTRATKVYEPAEAIIRRHAEAAGLTPADLTGPSRRVAAVRARQAAMAELWDEGRRLSLPVIGRLFGGRDHTTVLHAVRKVARDRA